jgi:hypothetical protein
MSAFDSVAERLEQDTSLSRLEARGTLRPAMKAAGFESSGIQAHELCVVIERILPDELTTRGVEDAGTVCRGLTSFAGSLGATGPAPDASAPEAIFRRLGGG